MATHTKICGCPAGGRCLRLRASTRCGEEAAGCAGVRVKREKPGGPPGVLGVKERVACREQAADIP